MPWRFGWAKRNLLHRGFWKRLFELFPETSRSAIVLAVFRILVQPRQSNSESAPSLLPELGGLGRVTVRNFSDFFIFWEIFIERCYDPFPGFSPAVIVDIGANVGFFALRMKQLFPGAQITCFEPLPTNFAALTRHIKLCSLRQVTAYELGVSDASGEVPIFVHPSNSGGHTIVESEACENASSLMISVIPIDEVIARTMAPHIDLLKLDCEGAEKQILMSLTPAHAKAIGRIVYEPMAASYNPKEIAHHLGGLGYELSFRKGVVWACRLGSQEAEGPASSSQ